MDAEKSFQICLIAGLCGYFLEVLAEKLVRPKLSGQQPWQARCLQFALFGIAYSILVIICQRPWCATAFSLAFSLILIFVNNAKYRSMREPFLFQDYDYFLDTLRFPRLFLPFLGIRGFCLCAAGVILTAAALWLETPPRQPWALNGQLGASLLFGSLSLFLFFLARHFTPDLALSPEKDLKRLGFLAFLGFYGIKNPDKNFPEPAYIRWAPVNIEKFPHLVAIQSESFFDARKLWPHIHNAVFQHYDQFSRTSFLHGDLLVPAWGANTERTEFTFLSGLSPAMLGMARFNPYRLLANGWHISALPAHLRSLGYRTICIHPYISAFYKRDKIFPNLGFDEFIDISAFSEKDKMGPYTGDQAVGNKILEIQQTSTSPTFIFAITMENHGPLHLENAPSETMRKKFLKMEAGASCTELPIYLRHISNTDNMLKNLKNHWQKANFPVSLCFYGDHVPIMPNTFKVLGYPPGIVPFFCWSNRIYGEEEKTLLACHQLADAWLMNLDKF